MNVLKGFNSVKDEYINYFKKYTYNEPVVISLKKNEELKTLGQILYKAIKHGIDNYMKYLHIMPREEKDLEILEICDKYSYRVGTFRTDFVVDSFNNIKIIEMTTRQPLNGYFMSGFFREIGLEQAARLGIKKITDVYPNFFNYLENYIGDVKHICVIKGNEKLEEIKIYPSIFEKAGIQCHIIPIEELPDKLHLLEDAFVIEELNFNEIRGFSKEIIESLAKCKMHNALKSLLTTHDKRFYYVLNHPEFLKNVLEPYEIVLLKRYLTPTFVYYDNEDEWEKSYNHKNEYILKHQIKGKSVDIYAGCVTEEAVWKGLFDSGEVKQMVLQPFIQQELFPGFVGEEERKDYAVGTLLYFNNEYFGPGLFRTSSHPVTNIVDNRKIAFLVADDDDIISGVNYIK